MNAKHVIGLAAAVLLSALPMLIGQSPASNPQNPILFVTQVPVPVNFSIGSTFSNHIPTPAKAPRGGDLYIRYPDGTSRNLTREAGFGDPDGLQGLRSIAVRNPAVHWSGQRALFSMVIGSPTQLYDYTPYYWQMYEVSGLRPGEVATITRVNNQPENCNNIHPSYMSDGSIVFASDRPKDGKRHLYPPRDEYDGAESLTGIYALSSSGQLKVLDFTPSGAWAPRVDSFGRVVYTRWDHLVRDQLKGLADYGAVNYSSEAQGATTLAPTETFPVALIASEVPAPFVPLYFNHFVPWAVNQDGTESETLNHSGRHEITSFFARSRTDDPAVVDFTTNRSRETTVNMMFLDSREDPTRAGRFLGTEADEFSTHSSGRLLALDGPPGLNADTMQFTPITVTNSTEGRYRNPVPLMNGGLVAVHTPTFDLDKNLGTLKEPRSKYQFRLAALKRLSSGLWTKDYHLTGGITRLIKYYAGDNLATFGGQLWELDPTEVVARPVPPVTRETNTAIEADLIASEGFSMPQIKQYLASQNLALMVTRNVTTRDSEDRQQPYNLRVQGSQTQTIGRSGRVYDVDQLQIFQGDYLRGYPRHGPGRRVVATPMHDAPRLGADSNLFPGSTLVAPDGSAAALVPAGRPLSWQLLSKTGENVVQERYWVNFQAGEVRVCGSCHGVNRTDQAGNPSPTNPPMALRVLLRQIVDSMRGSQQGQASISVTSSAQSGNRATFTARYGHPDGAKWIKYIAFQVDAGIDGGCVVYYSPRYGTLSLLKDDRRSYAQATAGLPGSLANSQCSIDSGAVIATLGTDTLDLSIPVAFKPAYQGTRSVYGYVRDLADRYYGWVRTGGFVVTPTP